ncbi:hypothetical protein H1C71_012021, partial [Ictidomys tridecemlineatus]
GSAPGVLVRRTDPEDLEFCTHRLVASGTVLGMRSRCLVGARKPGRRPWTGPGELVSPCRWREPAVLARGTAQVKGWTVLCSCSRLRGHAVLGLPGAAPRSSDAHGTALRWNLA